MADHGNHKDCDHGSCGSHLKQKTGSAKPRCSCMEENGVSCSVEEASCSHTGKAGEETTSCVLMIDGMDCADCAKAVEKAISGISGVKSARVNYAAGSINVEYENIDDIANVHKTIENLGYNVSRKTGKDEIIIHIEEMDCSEEVKAIKKALEKLPGITKLMFYPVNRELRVKLNREEVSPAKITSAIKSIGMTPRIVSGIGREKDGTSARKYLIATALSGIFILFALILRQLQAPAIFTDLLFLTAILTGGWFIFLRAIGSIKHLNADMNILMTIAVAGAIALGDWLEAATVVFLFILAQFLENRSMEKTRSAVRGLMEMAPQTATLKSDSGSAEVPSANVNVGDIIIIKPGDKIPLDGIVISGESSVNQAPITGESIPVLKTTGAEVFAGTINQRGSLEVKITRGVHNTAIARIVEMVEEAQALRAPAQAFVDKFSRYYTPSVIAGAILLTVIPVLFLGYPFKEMLYRSLVLLLIACPCALVISTPVSIVSGLSSAAKNGVLIKGGIHLENFAQINAVAFDKTGTITQGKLEIAEIFPLNGNSENHILSLAAAVESLSEHPIAEAIVTKAEESGIKIAQASNFMSITGMGAGATVDGKDVFVGSHRYFCSKNICSKEAHDKALALESAGRTVAVVGNDERIEGFIIISDIIRESAPEVISELKNERIEKIVMLTGDNSETADTIAKKLGIECRAELLPDGKVAEIEKMKSEGLKVAMVGDGVNDAPALAASTVGVAMGAAGSDTAMEVADIALMASDLTRIPYTLRLSRATLNIIKQNIALAIGIKGIFLILGTLGKATLWMAVFADMGASIIVILNGLRLLRFR